MPPPLLHHAMGHDLGRFWRQQDDGDVGGQIELVRSVPASLIHQQDGMGVGGDGLGYLGEMQVHRRGIAERQDETRRLAFGRTDRAEDVGRLGALIVRRRRPGAA